MLVVPVLPSYCEIWHLPHPSLSTLESRALLEIKDSKEKLKTTSHPKDTQIHKLYIQASHTQVHLTKLVVLYPLLGGESAFQSLSV